MKSIIVLALILLNSLYVVAGDAEMKIPQSFLNLYLTDQNKWTVFLSELSTQKGYLMNLTKEPAELNVIREFDISSGKQKGSKRSEWDLRTPVGIYQITQYRAPHTLQDKFGSGAFILDYPNLLDRTLLKTGGGIWIHGTDRIDFIDFDSEGCIRMNNEDIVLLRNHLIPGETPVIIVNKIKWVTEAELLQKKKDWQHRLDNLLHAIEERDFRQMTGFYHPTFLSSFHNMNIAQWILYLKDNLETLYPLNTSQNETEIIYHDDHILIRFNETVHYNNNVKRDRTRIILWKYVDSDWYIVLEDIKDH